MHRAGDVPLVPGLPRARVDQHEAGCRRPGAADVGDVGLRGKAVGEEVAAPWRVRHAHNATFARRVINMTGSTALSCFYTPQSTVDFRDDRGNPLDRTDWRLLAELQRDGRATYAELARAVAMSPSAVAERVRRLEEAGVIAGYRATVDPERVGLRP